jgi:hypothetical protein
MGKSKAKKARKKLEREGQRNPEQSRSSFIFSDMRTRKTKSKKDHIYRTKHKNQYSKKRDDGSFYFFINIFTSLYNNYLYSHTFNRTCSSMTRAAKRNIVNT